MAKRGSARRLYIPAERVKEFDKTKGCAACRGEGALHTEACRKRVTALVEEKEKKEAENAAKKPNTDFAFGSGILQQKENPSSGSGFQKESSS